MMAWTSSVGILVKEAGSSRTNRLNLPLSRLPLIVLVIDTRLLTVSMERFLWTVVRDRTDRMELL